MGRNIHFDFAKIFCSIKCYHLKIKSQFKLGILEHHDIRCHWCEAWFLIFWSICQSGKVGLVGFFQKVNIEQYALGGHHIAYRHCHRWFRWFLISSLGPLWALIFGSLLLPPLSIDDSLAVAVLHSCNLRVWKSISSITNQIQGMGDESIWIHQTAVNVWM